MKPEFDLSVIREHLAQLREAPFFNSEIPDFLNILSDRLDKVINREMKLSPATVQQVSESAWNVYNCFHNSTSREVPYELIYCLELALADWKIDTKPIIAPVLVYEKNFGFKKVEKLFLGFSDSTISQYTIINLQFPRIYKNTPLFCVSLYHELGHFIDQHHNDLSENLLDDNSVGSKEESINIQHSREYFADLFAASYVGEALSSSLKYLCGDDGDSDKDTHPKTKDRLELIDKFLSGKQDDKINGLQNVLRKKALPLLEKRYKDPDVNNLSQSRTVCLNSDFEVHGLFNAAWRHLEKEHTDQDIGHFFRINDLVEKSIRNYEIRKKWKDSATITQKTNI